MIDIDRIPRKKTRMTPKQFLRLTPKERSNIARSRFIAPKLGEKDFGRVEVIWKIPRFSAQ